MRTPCSSLTLIAPALSPYAASSLRKAAARSGTTMETWLRPVIIYYKYLILNHFFFPELGDAGIAETQFLAQHRFGVLAQQRRRAADARRRIAEAEGYAQHF